MAEISDLSDELLVKILSFLPTQIAVSTSVLSKRWEFLWMWLPNLDIYCLKGSVRDFFNKNLPLHKSPIIQSLRLTFHLDESLDAEASKSWVGIAVSRRLRELSIDYLRNWASYEEIPVFSFLPSSLYTCNSLVTLELESPVIFVDVPRTVCLPSLETLKLIEVTYSNDDSLPLLLSYCPVLEDLTIEQKANDDLTVVVITVSSLRRLSLGIHDVEYEECVIFTPSLKYFKVVDRGEGVNYLIDHMPELEEADIEFWKYNVKLLESITAVKRLSLCVHRDDNYEDGVGYGGDIYFSQLENLKLSINRHDWSNLLFLLLKGSPNLQNLDLEIDHYSEKLSDDNADDDEDSLFSWSSSVPECLLKSLKTFKFHGSNEMQEQRAVLSFIIKHACCPQTAYFFKTRPSVVTRW